MPPSGVYSVSNSTINDLRSEQGCYSKLEEHDEDFIWEEKNISNLSTNFLSVILLFFVVHAEVVAYP